MEFEQQAIDRPGIPFLGGGQTRQARTLIAADADVDRDVAAFGGHFRPDPNGPFFRGPLNTGPSDLRVPD
jgi:hypothetical protein